MRIQWERGHYSDYPALLDPCCEAMAREFCDSLDYAGGVLSFTVREYEGETRSIDIAYCPWCGIKVVWIGG